MPTREMRMLRVAQASGMISVQAECTIAEAVVLMETRAVATRSTLDQIAAAVIARDFNFTRPPGRGSATPQGLSQDRD